MNLYAITSNCEVSESSFKDYGKLSMIFLTNKEGLVGEHDISQPFRFWIDGNHSHAKEIQLLVELADDPFIAEMDCPQIVEDFCKALRGRSFKTYERNEAGAMIGDGPDGYCDMAFGQQPICVMID